MEYKFVVQNAKTKQIFWTPTIVFIHILIDASYQTPVQMRPQLLYHETSVYEKANWKTELEY